MKIGESHYAGLDILELLNLSKCLKVLDNQTVHSFIHRLNTKSFDKISVILEIKVMSKYILNGYKVINEPPNKRFGTSGQEGKSDIAVKFNGEWIYFEITQENFHQISDVDEKLSIINGQIQEEISKQNLLPGRTKILASIVDLNTVLSKQWSNKFVEHLKLSSFKIKVSNFKGVVYRLEYRNLTN